jgi:hypothetical protein
MESRVRLLETEVAVLGNRQTTSEAGVRDNASGLGKLDEKIEKIHGRINSVDRRLATLNGRVLGGVAVIQLIFEGLGRL